MKKGDLFFTTYDQDHMAYFLKSTHFLLTAVEKGLNLITKRFSAIKYA